MYGRYVAEKKQMPSDGSRVHILDGDSETFRCGLPRWTLSEGHVSPDSMSDDPQLVWWTNEASGAYHLASCPGCTGNSTGVFFVEFSEPEIDVEVDVEDDVEDMTFSWETEEEV